MSEYSSYGGRLESRLNISDHLSFGSGYVPSVSRKGMPTLPVLRDSYGFGGSYRAGTDYSGGPPAYSPTRAGYVFRPTQAAPSELYVGVGNWTSLSQRLRSYKRHHPFFGVQSLISYSSASYGG